ncbi:hypothetical protein DW806_06760 [Butyricicoccus sp. AM32-19]|uniref:replicative DNA helicase n=1 Tax=Butyricicoccus sp. AM32-19 TaxID=2292296 RepID=UPI000E49E01F|nr:DnaB-like helicase C-terminal domain-containing protein [Butyricicoccus sp. AM32-19]RHT27811.1 hypothetical protein DW806_06760 [Butyricicoccus sp. AM32-19]
MADMMDLYHEAEDSVLGTLIADGAVNAPLVFARVKSEDFVTGISRQIFETCRKMYSNGDVIDPLTVRAACGAEFMSWLKELEQITPSARYCDTYVDKLLEMSKRYRLQKLLREALDVNFAGLPIEELIGKIEGINSVISAGNDKRNYTMTDLQVDFQEHQGVKRQYLDFGFDELNRFVKANLKNYIVIGARPSAGKTAFALQVALHMAQTHNVTFFSFETDNQTMEDRMMALRAGVDLAHIQSGELTEDETLALAKTSKQLLSHNFNFYDACGMTVEEIRAVTNNNRSNVIVVDYLQLVRSSNPKHVGKEYETVTEVTAGLQRLAKSGVCVIALSQLSRGGEGMEALRSSGQIEQDADVIMLLDYPDEEEVKSDKEAMADLKAGRLRVVKIVKNKNGMRGRIPFWFCGSQQRFLVQWQGFYQSKLRMMEDDATA